MCAIELLQDMSVSEICKAIEDGFYNNSESQIVLIQLVVELQARLLYTEVWTKS